MADQISVSRETLRAELGELELRLSASLAQLELRLIDRLADKSEVAALEAKHDALERLAVLKDGPEVKLLTEHEARLSLHEAWRNKVIGGVLVVGVIASAAAARAFGLG